MRPSLPDLGPSARGHPQGHPVVSVRVETPSRPVLAPEPQAPVTPRTAAPSFSVVIAAYQVAGVVNDAITSVLEQTAPALEVIVVDDGSTDGLETVVARHGDRVRFLRHEKNSGAAAAMNTGAKAARGDYVVFIGADDVFASERLAALGELAQARPDLDILTTDAWISVHGRVFRRFNDETHPFEAADQRRGILLANFVFGHTAVPRERFLEVGGFDESIRWTSDWELWARMILSGSRVGSVAEPLATYRLHERALSSQPLQQLRGILATMTRIAQHPALTEDEGRVVAARLAWTRREIAVGEATQALLDGVPGARRRALGVFSERAHAMPVRMRALLAWLLPGVARRVLARRRERYWIGAGGVTVPRR